MLVSLALQSRLVRNSFFDEKRCYNILLLRLRHMLYVRISHVSTAWFVVTSMFEELPCYHHKVFKYKKNPFT